MFYCGHLGTPPFLFPQFTQNHHAPPPPKNPECTHDYFISFQKTAEQWDQYMKNEGREKSYFKQWSFHYCMNKYPTLCTLNVLLCGLKSHRISVKPRPFLVSFGHFTTCHFFLVTCKRKLVMPRHYFMGFLENGWAAPGVERGLAWLVSSPHTLLSQ